MTERTLSIVVKCPYDEKDVEGLAVATVFGNYVRKIRVARGMSQADLAERMETEQAEISKWERGIRKRPSAEMIQRFAVALGEDAVNLGSAAAGIDPAERLSLVQANETKSLRVTVLLSSDATDEELSLVRMQLENMGPVMLATARKWAEALPEGASEEPDMPSPERLLPARVRGASSPPA